MGKNKRQKHLSHGKKTKPQKHHPLTRPSGISKPQSSKPKSVSTTTPKPQHRQPILPFHPSENILLIGEGDISFSHSLITHHACKHITATVYESSPSELLEKYPHVAENVKAIEEGGGLVRYGVDAMRMKPYTIQKLEKGRREGVMDRVFFNFPHVGGKTKDVNRQVRYNQELLVSFFKNSLQSLSPKPGSSIIVTLFEGEPYTLWNIRDLGRHSGLEVKRSWKFQASAYPGYRHARTLGVVKGKNGEIGGGWKGEERAARSYEFVRKGEGVVMGVGKKRKESSDDEDENEDMEDDETLQEDEEEEQWEGLDVEDIHEEESGTENDDEDDDEDEDEDGD